MDLYSDMRMTYDQHVAGTYNQQSCPKCRDGVRNEKAMSVTKTHSHLKWICFHASCGFKGIVDHRSGKVLKNLPKPSKIPRPYLKETAQYDDGYLEWAFGVTTTTLINKESGRILFPVKAPSGRVIGHVARGYKATGWNGHGPKAVTYTNTLDVPFMHFASSPEERMVLVEDWVSAEKVSQIIPAIALLGTHLSQRDALYIRESGVKDLVVALDADAWNKYANLRQQYSLLFNTLTFKMWSSKSDPKDMTETELQEVFG